MGEATEVSGGALEEIAYLARSENRVKVLQGLTATTTEPGKSPTSLSLRQLREITDTSRTTLGRILSEFEERGWVRRNDDGDYEATPLAQHVAAEFDPLVRSVAVIDELGDAVGIIPRTALSMGPDDVAISLRHFRDATVRETASWDPHEVERFYVDLLEGASVLRAMIYVGPFRAVDQVVTQRARSGDLSATGVFSTTIVDRLLEVPEFGPTRDEIASDNIALYQAESHLPCNLWIVDETVVLENSQAEGVEPGTLLVSEDPTVWRWASGVFGRYLESAREVTAEDFRG